MRNPMSNQPHRPRGGDRLVGTRGCRVARGDEKNDPMRRVASTKAADERAVAARHQMIKEARERFAAGIAQFRARMLKAVEEQMKPRTKKPPAKPK